MKVKAKSKPVPRVAEVTATFALLTRDGRPHVVIRICRDLARPRSFYPVAFRNTYCTVKPAVAGGLATEVLALFKPLKDKRGYASEQQALRAALAELSPRRTRPPAKLVSTVEFGPYPCPGDHPWYFTADVYESLDRPAHFFALACRREMYRMKTPASNALQDAETYVDENAFQAAQTPRATARAALTAIADHITGKFAPADLHKAPVKLRQTFEIVRTTRQGEETFVARLYDGLARKTRFYTVSRRSTYRLTAAFTDKPFSGYIEVLEPSLARKRLASASQAAALKSIVASIAKLPHEQH